VNFTATGQPEPPPGPLGITLLQLAPNEVSSRGVNQSRIPNSDLQTIIDAWPDLPEEIKAGILAMIEAVKG